MAIINYSGNWQGYLEYTTETVSQNISANQSTVRVKIWVGCRWDIQFNNTYGNTVSVTVNGASQSLTVGALVVNNSKKYLGQLDFVVTHNQNGTGSANVSFSSNMSNISYGNLNFGNASGSYTHALTTIPRSSSLSVGSGVIGSSLAITINRQSNSFTHTLRYAWGSKSGTIASNVGDSHFWTIPNDFANDIPNATSGTGTLFVDTYSGGTKTGTQQINFIASVPSNIKPSFSGVTLTDANGVARSLLSGNNFLQIISDIQVSFNGATGSYGSSITGYRAEIVNRNQVTTSNGGRLGMMNFNGSATIRASVVDSRGRQSDTRDITINVIEYFSPILSFSAVRTRETPNIIQIVRNAKIAPITLSGSQKNVMTLTFKVAPLGSTSYTADNGSATGTFTTQHTLTNSAANMAGNYPANKSFTVIGTLADKFTSIEFSATVATESVVMSYDKDGRVGIGKVVEQGKAGSLDVAGEIFASDNIWGKNRTPIGHYSRGASVSDLNMLITAGIHTFNNNTINQPNNLRTWGVVEVIIAGDAVYNGVNNWIWQTYITTGGIIYKRHRINAGNWTDWVELTPSKFAVLNNSVEFSKLNITDTAQAHIGIMWGVGLSAMRKGNLVTLTVNRAIKNINSTVEYGLMAETIPAGYRPIKEAHLIMQANTGTTISGTAVVHIAPDGKVRLTNNITGNRVWTGTVTFITDDPYP